MASVYRYPSGNALLGDFENGRTGQLLSLIHIWIPNLVRMETRNANVEGCRPITIRDLIKTSLRMRPDRIIVGEVRGAESVDMIQAMSSGHDGSISTGHSGSPEEMLSLSLIHI